MPPILPPQHTDKAFKRQVQRQMRTSNTSQLVTPTPYPASPFGGVSPPDAMWYIPVTSAVYGVQVAQPWFIFLDRAFKLGFSIVIPWKTDSGTTGEIRLAEFFNIAPNGPTSAIALPANSVGNVAFKWLHGIPLYTSFDVYITVEARRTSGAGNVSIGYPLGGGLQCGPEGCTVDGLG